MIIFTDNWVKIGRFTATFPLHIANANRLFGFFQLTINFQTL